MTLSPAFCRAACALATALLIPSALAGGPAKQAKGLTGPDAAEACNAYAVVDVQTGQILEGKNAEAPMAPASLLKVSTLMRVEEAINKGDMNPNDNIDIPIIETGTKGNKHQNPHAYVCPGTDYPVRKIWRTTITQAMNAAGAISYNQAAEKLFTLVKLSLGDGGFIMGPDGSGVSNAKSCLPKKIAQEMKGLSPRQMGEIAQKYGIPTTTAYDMASLMAHIERNSDQYPLTRQALSTPSVIINGKEYKTTNRFVRNGQDISAKTGTTDLSGFNLAAVASGGKNAVAVMDCPDGQTRFAAAEWFLKKDYTSTMKPAQIASLAPQGTQP
jgi:D-alanyl-D-alanine carboxypeptidase